MKRTKILLLLTNSILSLVLALGLTAPALAQEASPQTSQTLPVPLADPQSDPVELDLIQPQALSLPPLKAVLLVGAIDGDSGPATLNEVASMRLAATVLRNNNVQVYEFYPPSGNWDQIKSAANGAHFFLYRGHGIFYGDIQHPDQVGGISIGGTIYSSDIIRSDIKLAPNAIIMLYGCYVSGSSGDDRFSITSSEAQWRVNEYSDPFFDLGAAGYYANWFGDAFAKFLEYLFQGKTLGDAYKSYADYNAANTELHSLAYHPGNVLWMERENWQNYSVPAPQYANTFAGQPDKTLADLFLPDLKVSSNNIALMVTPGYTTTTRSVKVTSDPVKTFTWAATMPSTNWAALTQASGTSGSSFTVQIASGRPLGKYTTTVQVTPTDSILNESPQTATVNLIVVSSIHRVYLPAIRR